MKFIKIDIEKIDIELAQLVRGLVSKEDRRILSGKFGRLLSFPFSENLPIRQQQLLAFPYLFFLKKQADKFNQRTGWWTNDYCPLVEDDTPINNMDTKVIVLKGEVKIVNRNDYPSFNNYYLEFADYDKYKGNAVHFVEIYKEIILKASVLLDPSYGY